MNTSIISATLLAVLVSASPLQSLVMRQAQVVLEILKVIGFAITTDAKAWVSPSVPVISSSFPSLQIASQC